MIDACLLLCYHASIDCAPLRPDHMNQPVQGKDHECLGGARGFCFQQGREASEVSSNLGFSPGLSRLVDGVEPSTVYPIRPRAEVRVKLGHT